MDEPLGLGEGVIDGNDELWVRVYPPGGPPPWYRVDEHPGLDRWVVWPEIPEPVSPA